MNWKIGALIGCFFLFVVAAAPSRAAVVWEDDLESGTSTWQANGFWHLQANPQHQHVRTDLFENALTLPDMGYLPYAYSGQHAWWYGQTKTGTYIGWPYPAQAPLSGGESASENSGSLITPRIDLTGTDKATLSFRTWWEVESVAPDWYDLMQVSVSEDKNNWTDIGQINPTFDFFGGAPMPHSSGGSGQIGNWVKPKFDLTAFAGRKIYVRFRFQTDDTEYNGFRGWLIDDIKVTNKKVLPSFKGAKAYSLRKCEDGQMVADPALFRVTKPQWVSVEYSQKFAITKYGKYVRVCANSKKCYLPKGNYMLWSYNYDGNDKCPSGKPSSATVFYDRAGVWPPARTTDDPLAFNFFGKNFFSGMGASIGGSTASEFAVVSANKAQLLDPTEAGATALDVRDGAGRPGWEEINENRGGLSQIASLPAGTYDLTISGAGGTGEKTMKKAVRVLTEEPPIITYGEPMVVDNDTSTRFTLTGENINAKTKILLGGMPMKSKEYDPKTKTLTGVLKKGASPGFQNVMVKNSNGLVTYYPNIIEVRAKTNDLYDGMETINISRPKKVKKIRITYLDSGDVKISWKKKARAKFYRYRLKRDGEVVKRGKIKASKHAKVLDRNFIEQYKGETLKVSVKALNKYKGVWSDSVSFVVE